MARLAFKYRALDRQSVHPRYTEDRCFHSLHELAVKVL